MRRRLVPLLVSLLSFAVTAPGALIAGDLAGYLYWTQTGETDGVWRSRTDGSQLEVIISERRVKALAIDLGNSHLYYGLGLDSQGLFRSRLDGTGRQLLVADAQVRDLELDVAGGKIYWIEFATASIRRANLDGSSAETLLSGLDNARGLGLDLEAGRMYFGHSLSVYSATLSGSDVAFVVNASNLGDIEIDTTNDKLYFSSAVQGSGLRRCDLDGMNCAALVSASSDQIELDENTVYFETGGALWTMDLDGMNQVQQWFGRRLADGWDIDFVNSHIYAAVGNIIRANFDSSGAVPLIGGVSQGIHGVAVDAANERVYFTDFTLGAVTGSQFDDIELDSLVGDLLGDGGIRGLALDESAGLLYWADNRETPDGGIWTVAVDGTGLTEIVPGLNKPHGVAIDTINGKIYWTQNIDDSPGTSGAIRRSDLAGTNVEDVLTSLSAGIRGIDVDPVNGKIYWTDHFNDEILWANLDGSSPQMILNGLDNPHDVAVDTAAGFLFWTEGIDANLDPNASLRRSNLDGTSPEDVLTGLPTYIRDLTVIYHRDLTLMIFSDGFEQGNTVNSD